VLIGHLPVRAVVGFQASRESERPEEVKLRSPTLPARPGGRYLPFAFPTGFAAFGPFPVWVGVRNWYWAGGGGT
jgi:hypothetical protein